MGTTQKRHLVNDGLGVQNQKDRKVVKPQTTIVEFVSVWAEGEVVTNAVLDLQTGEVRDIETSDDGEDYEHLEYEEIRDVGRGVSATVEANDDNEYFLEDLSMLTQFGGVDLSRKVPRTELPGMWDTSDFENRLDVSPRGIYNNGY